MDFANERAIVEGNFVFSLWQKPRLYQKYRRKIDEIGDIFSVFDSKFFYFIGLRMYQAEYKIFDRLTISSYLEQQPEAIKQQFNDFNGYRVFESIKNHLDPENVNAYFNQIIRFNVLDEIQQKGIDIDKDYENLMSMDVDQIKLFYNHRINKIFLEKSSDAKIEDFEVTDEDIEKLDSGAEMGIPIGLHAPLLDNELLGINRGETFIGATVNEGKTSFSLAILINSWLKSKIKCALVSNEQTIMEFKRLFMSMVSYQLYGRDGISRRALKRGGFSSLDKDKLQHIKEYIKENITPYLKFSKIFDYNIEDVKTIVETLAAQGYEGFLYDVFKADDDVSGTVVGEMKKMSKELFKSADDNDVAMVCTIQLGLGFSDIRFLTMQSISTSKHITEPATEVLLFRSMWDDEISGAEFDIMCYTYMQDPDTGRVLKNAMGEPLRKSVIIDNHQDIKLLFLAKTRNTRQGICLAYRYNGDFNVWEELGYCTPAHSNRNSKKR